MSDFEADPETIMLRKKIDELLKMGGTNDGLSFLSQTNDNYDRYLYDKEDQ